MKFNIGQANYHFGLAFLKKPEITRVVIRINIIGKKRIS